MKIIYKKSQTLYKPGQILHISSSSGNWHYVGIFRNIIPVKNLSDIYDFYTYCNLYIEANKSRLTLERGNYLNLDTSFEMVREATNEEKTQLFDALVKAFKDYDLEWANHFTDSTYFDILDWLAWALDVDLDDEANPDTPLGETINEIQNYIWDALCRETGNYQACTDYVEPEMVNKAELIDKTINYFTPILKTYCSEECVKELIDGFVNSLKE